MTKKKLTGRGGPDRGQGRKAAPYPQCVLIIQATVEEFEEIKRLGTRQRAEALLEYVRARRQAV